MTVHLSELGRTLKRAQYRHHLALDRALAGIGTTIVQWDTLRAISESPAASAHQLALTAFQSDQAFGALANRLELRGYISRSPGIGRRIQHHLTPAGENLLARGLALVDGILAASFAPLNADERETLYALLTRVGNE